MHRLSSRCHQSLLPAMPQTNMCMKHSSATHGHPHHRHKRSSSLAPSNLPPPSTPPPLVTHCLPQEHLLDNYILAQHCFTIRNTRACSPSPDSVEAALLNEKRPYMPFSLSFDWHVPHLPLSISLYHEAAGAPRAITDHRTPLAIVKHLLVSEERAASRCPISMLNSCCHLYDITTSEMRGLSPQDQSRHSR
jgi:hypothetical protein